MRDCLVKKQRAHRHSPVRSLSTIAKLLGADGFTDHASNMVTRYWKTKTGLTDRQFQSLRDLKNELGKLTATMTKADRLVLGKFIGLHKKMAFDTGLKMGLMTYLKANAEEWSEV